MMGCASAQGCGIFRSSVGTGCGEATSAGRVDDEDQANADLLGGHPQNSPIAPSMRLAGLRRPACPWRRTSSVRPSNQSQSPVQSNTVENWLSTLSWPGPCPEPNWNTHAQIRFLQHHHLNRQDGIHKHAINTGAFFTTIAASRCQYEPELILHRLAAKNRQTTCCQQAA